MAFFQTDDLEFVVDDYYHADADVQFEQDTDAFAHNQLDHSDDFESRVDSMRMVKKSDTSASEARNGRDIQGIPWERLNFTRDEYREARLKQYKNYESLSPPHQSRRDDLHKECLQVEKGGRFYDFQYNTRDVKSTIVHFQDYYCSLISAFKQDGVRAAAATLVICIMDFTLNIPFICLASESVLGHIKA